MAERKNNIIKFKIKDEVLFKPKYIFYNEDNKKISLNDSNNNNFAENDSLGIVFRFTIISYCGENVIKNVGKIENYIENDIIIAKINNPNYNNNLVVFKLFAHDNDNAANIAQLQRYEDILLGNVNIHGFEHVLNIGLIKFVHPTNIYNKQLFTAICMSPLYEHRKNNTILNDQNSAKYTLYFKSPAFKSIIDKAYNYNSVMSNGITNNNISSANNGDDKEKYIIHGDAKTPNIMFNGEKEIPCLIDYEYSFTVNYNLSSTVAPWNIYMFTQNDYITFPVHLLVFSAKDTSHIINNPVFFLAVKDILAINLSYIYIAANNRKVQQAEKNNLIQVKLNLLELYEAYGCYVMGYKGFGMEKLALIFGDDDSKVIDNFINTTLYYIKRNLIDKKSINYDDLIQTYRDITKCYENFTILNYKAKDNSINYIPAEEKNVLAFNMTLYANMLEYIKKSCSDKSLSRITTFSIMFSAFIARCKYYKLFNIKDLLKFMHNENNFNQIADDIRHYITNDSSVFASKETDNIKGNLCNIYNLVNDMDKKGYVI